MIIAGGTAPSIAVKLAQLTGNLQAPAFFVIAAALVGLAGLLSIRRSQCQAITY